MFVTVGLPGIFWLFMFWGEYLKSPKQIILTALNLLLAVIGVTICACGLWVSGLAIHKDSAHSGGSFSCASNA